MGTLGTNIWIFAYLGDLNAVFSFNHPEWWSSIQEFVRMVVLFLVNGKLLGLLTIMFGVGLELKYQQFSRRGNAWPGMYLWTSMFLLIEGLIHSCDGIRYFDELWSRSDHRFFYRSSW